MWSPVFHLSAQSANEEYTMEFFVFYFDFVSGVFFHQHRVTDDFLKLLLYCQVVHITLGKSLKHVLLKST